MCHDVRFPGLADTLDMFFGVRSEWWFDDRNHCENVTWAVWRAQRWLVRSRHLAACAAQLEHRRTVLRAVAADPGRVVVLAQRPRRPISVANALVGQRRILSRSALREGSVLPLRPTGSWR